jgi:CpcD/allophycocyanin linker domain
MNTIFNTSSDTDRIFALEIAGISQHGRLRSGTYTLKVAYSSLSKTLQSITRRGGKVVNVRMLSTPMPSVANIPVAEAAPPEIEPSPPVLNANIPVAVVVPPEIEPLPPVLKEIAVKHSPSKSRRSPAKSKKR